MRPTTPATPTGSPVTDDEVGEAGRPDHQVTQQHGGDRLDGHIAFIAPRAEFTPRNVQTVGERIKQVFGVKVRLDPKEGSLRAGMAADVSFPKVPR
jgi:hypothetical protein